MNKKGVCYDCPNRRIDCHSHCEAYIEWKKEHIKERFEMYSKKPKVSTRRREVIHATAGSTYRFTNNTLRRINLINKKYHGQ